MLPEYLVSMGAGNGSGAELVSGCGLLSALSQDLHGCFVWVFNMPDCFILAQWALDEMAPNWVSGTSARKADGM